MGTLLLGGKSRAELAEITGAKHSEGTPTLAAPQRPRRLNVLRRPPSYEQAAAEAAKPRPTDR